MRSTPKLQRLLTLIRQGRGEQGIYGLAQAARRPYRRVHDQVKKLAAEGLVQLEMRREGPRAFTRVALLDDAPVRLAHNRAWTRPATAVESDTIIALVLARPTFGDLLACVQRYGSAHVRTLYDDML